jgi:pyruvyl transferase EpsO
MTSDPLAQLVGRTYTTLRRLLPEAQKAAVMDFPAHQNFGDSLIYLGQQKYLRRLGFDIAFVGDVHRYSADLLRRRLPEGPIFLHGGGSLGDRYPETQKYREQVVADFPDRPIVQLPQSMDFTTPEATDRARRVFAAHPDLLLLLRDTVSLEKARRAFPDTRTEYCPDLAFGNGWFPTSGAPDRDLTMLLRGDSERAHDYSFGLSDLTSVAVDWQHTPLGNAAWKVLAVPRGIVRRFPGLAAEGQALVESTFEVMARANVAQGRRLLRPGRLVLTNRLHAAVLAALMRKPVVVLDNSYGKIAPIYAEYLHALPGVHFAHDVAEARRLILDLHAAGAGAVRTDGGTSSAV